MTDLIEQREITCPYCGESMSILLDRSAGDQEYIEDCQVCCRPMVVAMMLALDGEIAVLNIKREDE